MQIRPDISRQAQAQEPPGGYRKAISAVNSRTPLRKSELLFVAQPLPMLRSCQSTVAKQPLAL